MPSSPVLVKLYARVTICEQRCAGIENDPANGIMGRSFYCLNGTAGVDILLVSKNPGISKKRENAIYAPLDGEARVQAHQDFVRARFLGTNRTITSRYHKNIITWVAAILHVPAEHDAVFSRAAMTALVKCQSAGSKTDPLPKQTKNSCADAYLYSEIRIIKPRFLLALGGEPYNYLTSESVRSRHGLPVGKLYHPSWTNMPGGVARYIAEELPKIRQQYLRAIAA